MKAKIWGTPHNHKESKGYSSKSKSMTIPGQGISVKDVIERAQQGIAPEFRELEYGDPEVALPPWLDLTDIDAAKITLEQANQALIEYEKKQAEKDENEQNSDEE